MRSLSLLAGRVLLLLLVVGVAAVGCAASPEAAHTASTVTVDTETAELIADVQQLIQALGKKGQLRKTADALLQRWGQGTSATVPAAAAASPASSVSAPAGGYELYPINMATIPDAPSGLNFSTMDYWTKEGNVRLFIGVAEFPWNKFHIMPAPRPAPSEREFSHSFSQLAKMAASNGPKCDGRSKTSDSAKAYGCLFAQNCGFFDMATGGCLGNIISQGKIINRASSGMASRSHFGLSKKGRFVTGYLTSEEVSQGVDGAGFLELTQGNGWLIRNGKNFLKQSAQIEKLSQAFIDIKAPRNALGHDRKGRLLMVQADGEEDIDLGLTLPEFAGILESHFDVQNAINVDGGGSSVTVYKGEVVDKPTCHDTPEICERAVTTISCLLP